MKIELSGGIGNQLFQYSFGRYVNIEFNEVINYVQAPHSRREIVHDSKLADFNFPHSKNLERGDILSEYRVRVCRYLCARNQNLRKLILRYLGFYLQDGTGYDEEFTSSEEISYVRGYFQSFIYPFRFRNELIEGFKLQEPSEKFKVYEQLSTDLKPINIHVRRGDYIRLADLVGALDFNYYLRGIRLLRRNLPNSEVWVFSDAPDEIDYLVELIKLETVSEVRVISDLSDSESLKLMSLGSGIVIANSTFSWWAAFLGNYNENVIAPQPWYKNLENPSELIPSNWTMLPSTWQ